MEGKNSKVIYLLLQFNLGNDFFIKNKGKQFASLCGATWI